MGKFSEEGKSKPYSFRKKCRNSYYIKEGDKLVSCRLRTKEKEKGSSVSANWE